jgi:hypothetical protein
MHSILQLIFMRKIISMIMLIQAMLTVLHTCITEFYLVALYAEQLADVGVHHGSVHYS